MTSSRQTTVPAIVSALLIFSNSHVCSANPGGGDDSQSRIVCGPRCVQYVLQHYGHDADLVDLIKEIQWPRLEEGASLETLSAALEARAVSTAALRLGSDVQLCSREPVIVHIQRRDGDAEGGHFVVWLPASNEAHVHYWDGLNGIIVEDRASFARAASGVVLITSANPITETSGCYHVPRDAWSTLEVFLAVSFLGTIIISMTFIVEYSHLLTVPILHVLKSHYKSRESKESLNQETEHEIPRPANCNRHCV